MSPRQPDEDLDWLDDDGGSPAEDALASTPLELLRQIAMHGSSDTARVAALKVLLDRTGADGGITAIMKIAQEIEQLSGDDLDRELAGFMATGWQPTQEQAIEDEVNRRTRRAIKAWAKRMDRDPYPSREREHPPDREEPAEVIAALAEPVVLTAVEADRMIRDDVRAQVIAQRRLLALPPGRLESQRQRGRPETPDDLWGDVADQF